MATDLASLRIAVDSTEVKKAATDLDSLNRSANIADNSAMSLSASQKMVGAAFSNSNRVLVDSVKYVNNLDAEMRQLSAAVSNANAPIKAMGSAFDSASSGMTKAAKGANDNAIGLVKTGDAAKLSANHMTNLVYQLNDVVVGFASGQKPMTIFMQQGSQIGQIMMQAGVGMGGLVKAIGQIILNFAKAHPIMLAVTVVAGGLYAAFNKFTAELSKTAKLDEYANSLGLTEKEMKKLGPTSITAMDAIKGIWRTIDQGLGLSNVFNTVAGWFSSLFSKALSWAKTAAMNIYGALAASFDSIVYVWKNFPRILGDFVISAANTAIGGVENMINKAVGAMNSLAQKANSVLQLVNMPTIPELDTVTLGRITNQYAGAAASIGDVFASSFAKRTEQAASTLRAVGDAFSNNIVAAAKDRLASSAADIIDDRTKSAAKDAAGKAGKDAGEEFAKQYANGINVSALIAEVEAGLKSTEFRLQTDNTFEDEMKKLQAERNKAYAEQQKVLKENIEFASKAAVDIADLIGGSFGAGLKDMFKALNENFPMFVASLGGLFKDLRGTLDTFLAGFGTSLQQVGASIAVGASAAKMTGGSQVGGAIGGVVGQSLGSSLGTSIASSVGGSFGKMLGSFGGPIGAIAGGILGGIIGGLFKKTKQASATIEAAAGSINVAGIVGNDAKYKETANTLASAVVGGLNKIADALGADIVNGIKLSIGQRKDKFVVDLMGLGRTKGSGTLSFATEAEAISYAIDNAIRSGIMGGIRAGTSRLLQGFGDLEDRLQKAIDFESVFKAMNANADPFLTLLDNLDARFKVLIETFREAGATSEEWAILEKYYQQERLKAIEEGNKAAIEKVNSARDALTEAYNRESEAILTTLQRFQNLTADLESFRLSLAEQLMTAEEIYKAAKKNFDEVAALAAKGNEEAIAQLVSVSQKYLDAAKNFLTPEEYNREIQNVMKAVDLAIVQTKTMEDYAQLQLDALNNSVDGLITLNDSVLSVRDAIAALETAMAAVREAPPTTLVFQAPNISADNFAGMSGDEVMRWLMDNGYYAPPAFASGGDFGGGLRIVGENGPELEATGPSRIYNANQTASLLTGGVGVEQQISALRDEMKASLYAIAKNTGKNYDLMRRWDGDGMPDVRNWTA